MNFLFKNKETMECSTEYMGLLKRCIEKEIGTPRNELAENEEMARKCLSVQGDFVVCGGRRTGSDVVLLNGILKCYGLRNLYIIGENEKAARQNLQLYELCSNNVHFLKFDDLLEEHMPEIQKIALLYITNPRDSFDDFIRAFHDKVVPGGYICVRPDCQDTEDKLQEFVRTHQNEYIPGTPRGAFYLKRRLNDAKRLEDQFGTPLSEDYEGAKKTILTRNIARDARILEIGARYGALSCAMNQLIDDKTKQVAVEPDPEVWDALENNRKLSSSQFQVLRGAISSAPVALAGRHGSRGEQNTFRISGAPDAAIPVYTYEKVKHIIGFVPNTLVVDCEGAFVEIFRDFPDLLYDATRIFIDWDARMPRNNHVFRNFLMAHGFRETLSSDHALALYEKKGTKNPAA
jgi:FkbM family methyltransferase